MTSFTYRRAGIWETLLPICDSRSADRVSLNIIMLNSVGLAGPPCMTPLSVLPCFLESSPIFRTYRVWRICDIIAARLWGNAFLHRSINKSRRTVSYADLRYRTAIPFATPCYCVLCLRFCHFCTKLGLKVHLHNIWSIMALDLFV